MNLEISVFCELARSRLYTRASIVLFMVPIMAFSAVLIICCCGDSLVVEDETKKHERREAIPFFF